MRGRLKLSITRQPALTMLLDLFVRVSRLGTKQFRLSSRGDCVLKSSIATIEMAYVHADSGKAPVSSINAAVS